MNPKWIDWQFIFYPEYLKKVKHAQHFQYKLKKRPRIAHFDFNLGNYKNN